MDWNHLRIGEGGVEITDILVLLDRPVDVFFSSTPGESPVNVEWDDDGGLACVKDLNANPSTQYLWFGSAVMLANETLSWIKNLRRNSLDFGLAPKSL